MRQLAARIAVLSWMLGAALLAGCATEPVEEGPKIQPRARMPWQAAIGELKTNVSEMHCSGVLVARDIVVTASHCLFLASAQRPASPNEIVFRPNTGGLQALPPSRGTAFVAQGAVSRGGKLRNEDVSNDWVLIRVSPPITAVQPITVAKLTIDGMLDMIQSGNRLVTAGYGSGPYEELRQHEKCKLLSQHELGLFPDDTWLQLDCIFRVGDSGGAIVLLDGANQPALIGIIAGFGHMPKNKTEPLGLGVNAGNFAPYIRPRVSAQLELTPPPLN